MYHKSYRKPEPIVVTFTREQMTITSIPGPDRSIKTADIKRLRLVSKGDRNRRIGEFLKELDLAEARNTGYPVILGATKTNGSPKPILETNTHRDYFTFVLPIHEMFLKSDAETVRELNATDPVSDPVDSRSVTLVGALANGPLTAANLRKELSIAHRKFFRDHYVNPAIRAGLIIPEEGLSPHNSRLRYFITAKGRQLLQRRKEH